MDSESDYFSCISDYEDSSSDLSLMDSVTTASAVSESSFGDGKNRRQLVEAVIARERAPIDITAAAKIVDELLENGARFDEASRSKSNRNTKNNDNDNSENDNNKNSIPSETDKIFFQINTQISVLASLNNPVAPIITINDPYFEINKRHNRNYYIQDCEARASKLMRNPLVSRFFPSITQEMSRTKVSGSFQSHHLCKALCN